jgi:hypothetical protein
MSNTNPTKPSSPVAAIAAGLSLAVVAIHWIDQGGMHLKTPTYLGIGYLLLEVAGLAAAAMLLSRLTRQGWALALGVAAAPLLGYTLSRGIGLPAATDDVGNWTEPLGLLSLVVEAMLLILAGTMVLRSRRVELTTAESRGRERVSARAG